MAFLDVTEILSDPDFCTTFDVVQTSQTIGGNGRPAYTSATTPCVVGVVIPGKGTLERQPDGSWLTGVMEIYTTFPLSEGGSGAGAAAADVVIWNGKNYTVKSTNPWPFGQRFVVATVQLVGVNP